MADVMIGHYSYSLASENPVSVGFDKPDAAKFYERSFVGSGSGDTTPRLE